MTHPDEGYGKGITEFCAQEARGRTPKLDGRDQERLLGRVLDSLESEV